MLSNTRQSQRLATVKDLPRFNCVRCWNYADLLSYYNFTGCFLESIYSLALKKSNTSLTIKSFDFDDPIDSYTIMELLIGPKSPYNIDIHCVFFPL
jgi:hypothetical protein